MAGKNMADLPKNRQVKRTKVKQMSKRTNMVGILDLKTRKVCITHNSQAQ